MGSGFGAGLGRVDRLLVAVHHVLVECVFNEWGGVLLAEKPLAVGLILREKQLWRAGAVQAALAEGGMGGVDGALN